MQSNPNQVADFSAMQEMMKRGLLQAVFDGAPTAIFVLDMDTLRVTAANKPAQKFVGAPMRKLQQLMASDLLGTHDMERLKRVARALRHRRSGRAKVKVCTKEETPRCYELNLRCVTGSFESVVVFANDITDAQSAAYQASMAEERLTTAIEALSDGFVLYDASDRLVTCNARYKEIYSASAPAMQPGAKFEDILRYGYRSNQYDMGFDSEDDFIAHRLSEHSRCTPVYEQRLSDGRWLRIVERETSDGGRVGLRIDITHMKEQQQKLRKLLRTDELTGLLNRQGLGQKLMVAAAGLAPDQRMGVIHLDLDRFSYINEMYGNKSGDVMLKRVAKVLEDMRPEPVAIARVGGDEFIVATPTDMSPGDIKRYCKRLIRKLSTPVLIDDHICEIGASMGLAFVTSENAENADDYMTAANIALNEAKRKGGKKLVEFREEQRQITLKRIEMAKEIQAGLANNEFFSVFQPQVDVATGQTIGFESLIRWRHPKNGMVPVNEFLSVAERAGLTDQLDDLVMDQSCGAVAHLKRWGISEPHVSINLSTAQISDPLIVGRLANFQSKHDVSASNLRIELLESTLLDDRTSVIINNVNNLIAAGYEVELDDFGTGHAAIATLRRFSVSKIKVDRSLIQNINADEGLQVITSALIELAKKLGIATLAEGVETPEEQQMVKELGCTQAQGYLHARPMPLSDLRIWLENRGDLHRRAAAG